MYRMYFNIALLCKLFILSFFSLFILSNVHTEVVSVLAYIVKQMHHAACLIFEIYIQDCFETLVIYCSN
jgi:hypothetical protein